MYAAVHTDTTPQGIMPTYDGPLVCIPRRDLPEFLSDKLIEVFLFEGDEDDPTKPLPVFGNQITSAWYDAWDSPESPEDFCTELFSKPFSN